MKKLLDNRWFLFAMPFVIWFLVLVLPFLVSVDGNNSLPEEVRRRFIINIITGNFLLLCLFYIHTYLVYPLLNKKVIWYIVGLAAVLGLYWLCWYLLRFDPPHGPRMGHQLKGVIDSLQEHRPHEGKRWRRGGGRGFGGPADFIPFLSPLIAILCSVCYRIILDNRAKQHLLKERETAHLESELTFLRSQISPHFMFNILNNLVSLARKKSDDLEPAIMNLSQLMRYMLYESDDHRVFLSKEIEYIKSYINLQMLRFGSNVKMNIAIEGNTDLYTIEPMLLIPFVENAFKHGTGMVESPVIDISINIDADMNLMHFKVINKVSPMDVSKDNNSGIGISNVKRRLAILYPGKHNLDIAHIDEMFTIDLSIYLAS
jgi:two-component system LytT family sensor kinase